MTCFGKPVYVTEAEKINDDTAFIHQEVQGGYKIKDNENISIPEGAILGNIINVDKELLNNLKLKWSPLENIAIEVPDCIKASSIKDVETVFAKAIYTDASIAIKKVLWNTEDIDFSKAGVYRVKGTVIQKEYPFPLAENFGDPVIFRWEDKYYFIATNDSTGDIGLFVREAETVSALFEDGVKQSLILDYNEELDFIKCFWAPEFHVIDNKLYILFAVSSNDSGPQAHMMKFKKGGSILDPNSWETPIRVRKSDGTYLASEGITLDMTYFEVDGQSYVSWSYRYALGTDKDSGSMIYLATIDPKRPWQLTSSPVLLTRPLFGWENNEHTINNEGPYAMITDKEIYITYSGGACNNYTYAIGLLSIKRGMDLLNPKNWRKSSTPVLSYYSIDYLYGAGHNSFFKDDTGELVITYHSEYKMTYTPRSIGIHRVHFDIDGVPRFDMSANRDLNDRFRMVSMDVIVE
mgnify:FL=1